LIEGGICPAVRDLSTVVDGSRPDDRALDERRQRVGVNRACQLDDN
jgi:hypothetical protein